MPPESTFLRLRLKWWASWIHATLSILAFVATFLVPASVPAQGEFKVAVVDGRRALISSSQGRAAEKKLKALMDSKKKQIEPLEAKLKRDEEEFASQKYVLNQETTEARQLELLKQRRDLERMMREAQDDLEIEQRKLMQPMLKEVEDVLKKIGKEKGFTMILEKTSPGVLYASDSLDITDIVIQQLNEK